MKKEIDKNSFLLISHYATYAMQDLLFDYLTRINTKRIDKYNIPLPDLPFAKKIDIEVNKNGKTVSKKTIPTITSPKSLAYLLQFFQLLLLHLFSSRSYDIVIAQNSLLAIIGFVIRLKNKKTKIVFYSHGIDQERFKDSLMNKFYRKLDLFAANHANFNWVLGKSMVNVRISQGIPAGKLEWVPVALNVSEFKRDDKSSNNRIIFLGVLNEMNGAMLLPDIIYEIRKTNPKIELDIIGDGEKKQEVVDRAKKLKVLDSIHFLGIQTLDEYKKTLTSYLLGIAPYKFSENNLLQRTDPMKPRLYIAAGLPVVSTKGFYFVDEFEENGVGIGSAYTPSAYAKTIINLINNKDKYVQIRKKCLEYAKKFDQKIVYKNAIKSVIEVN